MVTSLDVRSEEKATSPSEISFRTTGYGRRGRPHPARQDTVRRAVASLPEPQRSVVRLRYGLDDGDPVTVTSAARTLHMRPARVRALEADGLASLALRREMAALAEAG